MKRHGNLFSQVIDFGNLLAAAHRARQGCGWGNETMRFFFYLEPELLYLRNDLANGRYQPGPYRLFEVRDPKQRTIAVAPFRDRVVHHALVAVIESIYEPIFISDSFATRKGKGVHAAIHRAQEFLRLWPWHIKMDVEKFFDSVNHDILLALLARRFKDRPLMALLEQIVRNSSLPGIGIPIGNLTSQFLANVYLDPFDHQVKECWCIPGYVRYMDDWVIFGESREDLLTLLPRIEDFLQERLCLYLKPTGTRLDHSGRGLGFLGMRLFPNLIRHASKNQKRSLRRIEERMNQWKNGELTDEHLSHSLNSTVGHLRHFKPKMRIPDSRRNRLPNTKK
ncbi:MAG: reverse transcriptase/maturase family protein [Magnetococcus sp. YQC-5]